MKTWNDFGLSFPDSFSGEQYSTCPECSQHRKKKTVKCLSANGDKLAWVCHHCGWSGTLKEGIDHKSDPRKWTAQKYRKPEYKAPVTALPREVVQWFNARGISEQTLSRNKIGHESVYMPQVEDHAPAIRFPFYRNGEVVNVKSRTLDKNFRLETNAERIFYGMDDVDGDSAIIVEGEIDKLSLEEAGFKNVVSVPDGAPAPNAKDYSSKFSFLESCEPWLEKIKRFIIAVDSDEPGQKLEEELARRLGKHRCQRTRWPDDCKDANDVLIKHGKEMLTAYVETAGDYPIEGIFDVMDIEPQIDALYNSGMSRGESTGWVTVDEHYTVRPGEVTIITGIPGGGKSEWLDALMVNLAEAHDWGFAVFSPENHPPELHFAKWAEKLVRKPFSEGYHQRMDKAELERAKAMLQTHFTFILPKDDQLTVDALLELVKHVILKKGVKGAVFDPWNEIDHSRPANLTETEYISSCLTKIRRFAREYGVHFWVVAHPSKLQKKPGQKDYAVPTPYDISGSAHWRNKADNCIAVHRNYGSHEVEIHIQKIRFKITGNIGMVPMLYDTITGRYRCKEAA